MRFDDKPFGGSSLLVEGAAGKFENPVAVVTVKMMVMALAGALVQGPQGRVVDLLEPALVDQQFEVAVDRGLIERFDHGAAMLEDFLNPQGPFLNLEDLLDGCAL
jgi:hypothetical protein